MISALLYLQYHSARNRLANQYRRLKNPKYLIGAVVGGAYFYFYFVRGFAARRSGINLIDSPEHQAVIEALAAFALFLMVFLGGWLLPRERAALTFTEAEVAFLFPSPISRRGLVHFKLLKSQGRILLSILFLTLIGRRWGGNAFIRASGWWLILSTLNLHFLGASFARTRLLDHGFSTRLRRFIVAAAGAAALIAGVLWARRTAPHLALSDGEGLDAFLDYARRMLSSAPFLYVLYPFRLAVRPFLAPDMAIFLKSLAPAVALLLGHYLWVFYSDVAFEESSLEASQKLAVRMAAARAGNVQGAKKRQKRSRPLFKLNATGPLPTALFWKNLIAAGQTATTRLWIMMAIVAVCVYVGLGDGQRGADLSMGAAILVIGLLSWSLLAGPQILRQDLRQDLPLADVLKTYPLRGWQIVLGEVLAPAVILMCAQWLLLAIGLGFFLCSRSSNEGFLPWGIAAGAAMLLPALNLVQLLIPNAAVLIFPSWIPTGKDAPRGIEATGQRLILMLGQMLALAIALVPAGLAFAAVFFIVRLAADNPIAIVAASAAGAVTLAAEGGLGIMLLGRVFERLDLSAETTN